jgi:hypothetical protein
MIYYSRGEWLGTHYLLYVHGSCFLRTLPTAFMGGTIAFAVSAGRIRNREGTNDPVGDFFGETYPMQLFGIVFGYLMVSRLNICYSRYWEGVSHVKTMHSKWADACSQVIAFDRCEHHDVSAADDAFCCHIVRLFSQARRAPSEHGAARRSGPLVAAAPTRACVCCVLTVWGGHVCAAERDGDALPTHCRHGRRVERTLIARRWRRHQEPAAAAAGVLPRGRERQGGDRRRRERIAERV